jgi:Asp-tRNA(Asn)/Glu-tRNA(Gln) amidotransferase A subunit family amidase
LIGKIREEPMPFETMSVASIIADIGAGRVSASESVAAARRAIATRDGEIGAFECVAPDARPAPEGPLAGIAVGVKDIFDTHDLPTAYGSDIFAGHRPKTDAAIVALLRRAGATIIGKTVTTEYAFLNPARTRNPNNTAHTPGGSSSGSAAAVAAGMVPAAIGTQTGGSVIRPAAYCGVAGYKPSFRLVPATGMKTFSWSLDTVGFFSAGVHDVVALVSAVTGRDFGLDGGPAQMRFGLYRSGIDDRMDEAMSGAVDTAASRLRLAGHKVIAVREPEALTLARDAHPVIQNFEAALALADDHARFAEAMSPVLRAALDQGRATPPDAFDDARRTARHARKAAHDVFADCDVLLLASAPGAAPHGLASTGDPAFNKLWTLLGLPAVNVPGLKDGSGMPLGMQIIAPFGRDKLALNAAALLETVLKG